MVVESSNGNSGMEEVNFSDNELVHHVRNALKSVSLGDRESYDELIGVMHHKERLSPDEVAMLVTCLRALSGAITCLDAVYHGSLLSSIFGMSMWDYGPEVMDALIELVKSLAQSGKFLVDCLDMLVKNFTPPYTFLPLLKQPRGITRKDHVLSRVHSALESITELVPLAPATLLKLVIDRTPRQNENEAVVLVYAENMFRLEKGPIGELVGDNMLKGVVDRLTELDVDISWEDILQDDSTKGIFELELEDLDDLEDDFEDGDELPGTFMSRRGLRGNIIAGKLDSLLVLTFEHLESCNADGRLDKVFGILLDSFTKTILNAYKSKFAQFVMFYACALDPERCGTRFVNRLVDIFTSSDYPPLTRMSAVAYLSSYLARGKFVSTNIVTETLKRLSHWCLAYSEVQNSGNINPQAHCIFYSGCQAIMYVLCFRMGSMVSVPWLKSQISLMPIETVLKHRLNPLKVCLPSVVEEFLRQARSAQLFTVSDIFVFNDVLESELSKAYGGIARLDMFFPFDPCLLRKSDRFIRPNYIYWSMVMANAEEDEDEEGDEEDGDPTRHVDDMAMSYENRKLELDDFDLELNKMSITPKNRTFAAAMQMPSKLRPSMSPPQPL